MLELKTELIVKGETHLKVCDEAAALADEPLKPPPKPPPLNDCDEAPALAAEPPNPPPKPGNPALND
jgi:hypothetical protein